MVFDRNINKTYSIYNCGWILWSNRYEFRANMTFSPGSIAGHHMMHEMDVVTKVAGKLLEIQRSQYFDRSSVLRRPLKVGFKTQMFLILAQIQVQEPIWSIPDRKLVSDVLYVGKFTAFV